MLTVSPGLAATIRRIRVRLYLGRTFRTCARPDYTAAQWWACWNT
jgi:hypothetical protein